MQINKLFLYEGNINFERDMILFPWVKIMSAKDLKIYLFTGTFKGFCCYIPELLMREKHLPVTPEVYGYFSWECYNVSKQKYTK